GANKGFSTRDDLFKYLKQVVLQKTDNRQDIVAEPGTSDPQSLGQKVLVFSSGAASPDASKPSPVTLKIINGPGQFSPAVPPKAPYSLVGSSETADLIFDAEKKEVVGGHDIIARDVGEGGLAAIIDRTAVIAAVNKLTEASAQTISVLPDNKLHHQGEGVTF